MSRRTLTLTLRPWRALYVVSLAVFAYRICGWPGAAFVALMCVDLEWYE